MTVNPNDIEIKLLTDLYVGLFNDRHSKVDLVKWCEAQGQDANEARNMFHKLNDARLIESKSLGLYPGLSNEGIQFVESGGLCPELSHRQDSIRRALLYAAMLNREKYGRLNRLDWRTAMRSGGFGEFEYAPNAFYLRDLGLIELHTAMYSITDYGAVLTSKLRQIDVFGQRWQAMKLVEGPKERRKRGHDLEDLIFDLANFEGLEVDRRVRSPGEENDLVVTQGFDHFLVSCKWEQIRSKAEYLDVIRARIAKRPGTNGVIVSVGGFSSELVTEAESNTSLGLVLLIGKADLERLFNAEVSLATLLQERHTALVRYRRAIFEE